MTDYTTGHCEYKKQAGGCPHHNLQCGWPNCDRRPVQQTPTPDAAARASDLPRVRAYKLAWMEAADANMQAITIGGPAREKLADEKCRYFFNHFSDMILPVIAGKPVHLTTPSDAGGEAVYQFRDAYGAWRDTTKSHYEVEGQHDKRVLYTTPPNPGDARLRTLAAKWRAELDRSSVSSDDYAHGFDVAKSDCLHELLSLLDGKGVG